MSHDRRWGPCPVSGVKVIPESCLDCLVAPNAQEHCALCLEKKAYHKTMNEVVNEPGAIYAATQFFMTAIDDCPSKLTHDYVVQSEQSDLIKEASMDTIDYALRHIIKTTLEADPKKKILYITPEDFFQRYQAYVEIFEKGDKGGADGYRSFIKNIRGKTIDGMDHEKLRQFNGHKFVNPVSVWKLDLERMATVMKADVMVESVSEINEAIARSETPGTSHNRNLPAKWIYRFENTEEWIRAFVKSNSYEEENSEEDADHSTTEELDPSCTSMDVSEPSPAEQSKPVEPMSETKKRKQPLYDTSTAKKQTPVNPVTGFRPCGCGPFGGCPACV